METIYSIDYLNSLTMNELYNIAKKYPFLNFAEIDRSLSLPKGRAHEVLTKNSSGSRYVKSIKTYLIGFIIRAQAYNGITAHDLYREALFYKRLTYTGISKVLKCSKETVSKMINGDESNRKILELKDYLNDVIKQNKITEDEVINTIKDNQNDWLKIEKELQDKKIVIQKNLEVHTDLLDNQDSKEFYNYLISLTTIELCDLAKQYKEFSFAEMEKTLGISNGGVRQAARAKTSKFTEPIRAYLIGFLLESGPLKYVPEEELNLKELFEKVGKYRRVTQREIADAVNCGLSTVHMCKTGRNKGNTAYRIKRYLESIISQYEEQNNIIQEEQKEQETMTEETLTDTKEMKTYDDFLNFIDSQKELPIVKKALDETLSENQNLDKILAKEEFITIETAQELNEKIFANEYTEAEILDFENQYYGTVNDDSLKDKIKSFVEKHNLTLETALKLLQISEEDYKKLLEGADKISNKSADKIYKAISAFDEFYHSEKTQNTINNTKNTFVTGVAIASAKGQTFLNKGLNKFADFLSKSADKIKNSNSENKED